MAAVLSRNWVPTATLQSRRQSGANVTTPNSAKARLGWLREDLASQLHGDDAGACREHVADEPRQPDWAAAASAAIGPPPLAGVLLWLLVVLVLDRQRELVEDEPRGLDGAAASAWNLVQ